ncbi:MAG TPA: universal stress protein [Thermomicrobiales bacterium]|nr:universal stress protein [Thermomicrobiales bacterium]
MKILACIDTSRHADDVLDHAAWLAQQMSLPVEVLHALEKPTSVSSTDLSGMIGVASRETLMNRLTELDEQRNRLAQEGGWHLLAGAVEFLRERGVTDISQRLVHGSLADHIRDYDRTARVIVVGKKGESNGRQDDHLGINLERIIRASTRPVLVTTGPRKPVERFIIAFDGGPTTGKAIDMLARDPLYADAEAHLLMVGDETSRRQEQVSDAAERLRASGHTVVEQILPGQPEEVIPAYLERVDAGLLIMGAYGHSRIREWVVGSTTTALLRKSTVPLLILR